MAEPTLGPSFNASESPYITEADLNDLFARDRETGIWRRLVFYASRFHDDLAECEDFVQQACERVLERLRAEPTDERPRLAIPREPERAFRGYCSRVVVRLIQNYWAVRCEERKTAREPFPVDAVDPEIQDPDLRLILEQAISTLPERQRTVVDLTRKGHSDEEIAKALGVTDNNVRQLRYRAISHLRTYLRDPVS